ncbi:MAG: FtsQ-type POTRA domain-containing protein [Chloroflexota bacterium]
MRGSAARSRSETVRKRRKQQASQRLSNSSVLATRPVAPITSRTSAMPVAPLTGRPVARRRNEAAWSLPGIEIRMPMISFSGPGAKWRFVSFGLSLLLGAALYLAATSPTFQAAPLQVRSNERIPAEEVAAVLGIGNARIFGLIPADLERRLRLNFPELLRARVTIGLPNQVYVELVERTPRIAWHQDGGYTWVDDSGVAFRPRGAAETIISVQAQNAPIPGGASAPDPLAPLPFLSPELVAAIQALAPHAPAGTALTYDVRYGFGWTDSRGWQAYFGDQARDMALKLRVYESMVEMVGTKGIRPAFISVQYPSAPYYRMSQ